MKYLSEQFLQFSATYSCGAYGAGEYNSAGACTTDSGLANTGLDVLVPLAAGSLMIVISTAYFAMKLWRKKKAHQQ